MMTMISRAHAAAKVIEYVKPLFCGVGNIVINEAHVIEDENAWVFPYNTKEFLDTEDLDFALMSNNPILVCKRSGCLHHYTGSMTAREMLSSFYKSGRPTNDSSESAR
ncbi:YrhB domain-containing protein [Lacipirellula limnantheis]|nr:YrhB domain-containing protein [Lacipirellula limnantheis]